MVKEMVTRKHDNRLPTCRNMNVMKWNIQKQTLHKLSRTKLKLISYTPVEKSKESINTRIKQIYEV